MMSQVFVINFMLMFHTWFWVTTMVWNVLGRLYFCSVCCPWLSWFRMKFMLALGFKCM